MKDTGPTMPSDGSQSGEAGIDPGSQSLASLADRMAGFDAFAPAGNREFGALVSFHYFRNRDLASLVGGLEQRPRIFSDSGGFSAHTQGSIITVDDYGRWLRRNKDYIDDYATLDVIYDWKGTLRNQLKLEQMGLRPMPVLHYGSPPEEIERYVRRGYEYMCLGGLVPKSMIISRGLRQMADGHEVKHEGKDCIRWLDRCHIIAKDCGMKLHGFGLTNWRAVLRWPWFSVDSSSWVGGSRFGGLRLFDPSSGRWTPTVNRGSLNDMMSVAPLLRQYGLPVTQIACDTNFTPYTMVKATARSWLVAQRHLERKRGFRTTIYLALSDGNQMRKIVSAIAQRPPQET